jgi:hypothetical protein
MNIAILKKDSSICKNLTNDILNELCLEDTK